jgi:DNA-binding transcriptional LysR family regulator
MHEIHLHNLDLNLLVVLDALLEHESVTTAADRIGRTQSSVSHSLRRLRETFGDELLVRVGNSMEPTEYASELREPLRRVLTDVRNLVTNQGEFDPATYERTFRIGTTEFGEVSVLPDILKDLREEAPNVRLVVVNAFDDTDRLVRDGSLDVALGTNWKDLSGLVMSHLFREHFVCLMAADHPLADGEFTVDDYVSYDHALVTPRGLPGGIADTLLQEMGRSRRVILRTPHFLSAGFAVSQTDLLLTIPSSVVNAMTPYFDVVSRECPFEMPTFKFSMLYSELYRDNPGHSWLRDFIAARVGE